MVGRMAYFWGWPLMANANCAAAFSKVPNLGSSDGMTTECLAQGFICPRWWTTGKYPNPGCEPTGARNEYIACRLRTLLQLGILRSGKQLLDKTFAQ